MIADWPLWLCPHNPVVSVVDSCGVLGEKCDGEVVYLNGSGGSASEAGRATFARPFASHIGCYELHLLEGCSLPLTSL